MKRSGTFMLKMGARGAVFGGSWRSLMRRVNGNNEAKKGGTTSPGFEDAFPTIKRAA
jgi:hypothetical protein